MNELQECQVVTAVEEYRHGIIGSRELLRQVEQIVGDAEAAADALTEFGFSAAELWARDEAPGTRRPRMQVGEPTTGITVKPDDPAITVGSVEYRSEAGTVRGYLAQPRGEGRRPGVIVIHENRGLVEHIKDVARRAALAGYVALAPDLLSREGGTDAHPDQDDFRTAMQRIPPEGYVADLGASLDYLKSLPFVNAGRVGVTGFCFGGGLTWRLATKRPDLAAAVPFYGASPPLEDVPGIAAAILAIYAEIDERINAGIPALEEALKATAKRYEKVVYPGARHAFHNDTGANYDREAARDAWARTLAHFGRHLKGEVG